MKKQLTEQEQLDIIKEVGEKYSKFLDPNFDASVFLECRDNFALTSHIESIKIFEMDNPPSNPTFTIAIPAYNRCETLKEAIDSALAQETDDHYEIIVIENVDDFDARTEVQEMLERDYRGRLTYYKNKENIGLFGNWNRCLTLAKGQWVCILHGNDMITSDYIEEMKKAIHQISQHTILIGCLEKTFGSLATSSSYDQIFLKNNTLKNKIKNIIFRNSKYFNNLNVQYIFKFIPPNAVLHHKERSIKIGGYNPDEYPIADNFFHTRAYLNGGACVYLKHLQKRRMELNDSLNPKTQMAYCYVGVSFFLGLFPKKISRYMAWCYLQPVIKKIKHTQIREYLYNRFSFIQTEPKPYFIYRWLYFLRFFLNKNKKILFFIRKASIQDTLMSGEISEHRQIFPSEHIEYFGGSNNYNLTDIFGKHHRHFHPYEYDTGSFFVNVLPHAFCFYNQEIVFTKNKRYIKEQTSHQFHPLDFYTETNSKIKKFLKRILHFSKIVRFSCLLLFSNKTKKTIALLTRQDVQDCYGHFIRDVIGGYYQIYKFEQNSNIKIDYYILPCRQKFQIEMYEKLGIPRQKIIPSETKGVIRAENIVIPTILSDFEIVDYRGYIHTRNYSWPPFVKEMYFDLLKIKTKPFKKIFLKRPKNSNRNIVNSDEVEQIFSDYGYQIILPDLLSIDEQILLFSQTLIIASMHGSGLNNLLFAQDKIYVFEIFSEFYHNNHPQAIAILKKCKYYYLVGTTEDISCHPQQENVYVSPSTLKQALDIIEREMSKNGDKI